MGVAEGHGARGAAASVAEATEIIAHFSASDSKSEILMGVLRFARKYCESVAVFSVHQQNITWLAGEGPNLLPPDAAACVWPLQQMRLFQRCIRSGAPYRGPVPVGADEDGLFAGFIQSVPQHCWIYPAAVGDHIDTLYYMDGPRVHPAQANQRIEYVIHKATLALRRLLIAQLLLQYR